MGAAPQLPFTDGIFDAAWACASLLHLSRADMPDALHACATAALTIYDMCKSVDRGMRIDNIRLLEKQGGRSGRYVRSE